MAADQGEKCNFCRGGLVDPATGECDMCGQKVQKVSAATKEMGIPFRGSRGGYNDAYQRFKRDRCRRRAQRLAQYMR